MSNLPVKDGNGVDVFIKKQGIGTDIDPFEEVSYIDDTSLTIAAASRVLLSKLHGYTHKFGENDSSSIGLRLPIWSQNVVYPYPTTDVITDVKQVVDDISMRGSTIEVQGLDASWSLVTQTIVLNATNTTTLVTLTTPLIRIFRMKVLANVVAAQNVVAVNAADTVIYAEILASYNQTLMAIFTVPAGKTAYLVKYFADVIEDPNTSKDPDATEIILWTADRANNYEFQVKHERGIVKGAGGFTYSFEPYMKITEKTDIQLTAECSGRVGHVHAGFCLILINN